MATEKMLRGQFVKSGGVHIEFTESRRDVQESNVRACILTMKGQVPSQPNIGSNAKKMVFMQNTQDRKALLSLSIREDIASNVPAIGTLNVAIDEDTTNLNRLNVSIYFLFEGETGQVTQGLGG